MKQDFEKEFLVLLSTHKGIIYKISHAYANDSEDRRDLFQEIVLSLWKAYPFFKQNSKISTWVYRVGLYTAITDFRHQERQIKYQQLPLLSMIDILDLDSTTLSSHNNVKHAHQPPQIGNRAISGAGVKSRLGAMVHWISFSANARD